MEASAGRIVAVVAWGGKSEGLEGALCGCVCCWAAPHPSTFFSERFLAFAFMRAWPRDPPFDFGGMCGVKVRTPPDHDEPFFFEGVGVSKDVEAETRLRRRGSYGRSAVFLDFLFYTCL
jgi:hypothetical protein